MLTAIRTVSAILLVAYLAFLAAVLTQYNPTVATDVVGRVSEAMTARGLPDTFSTPERVEFGLNALMFSPLVFLAALTLPRHPWANWVVYAFVGSAAVELLQGVYLPPRSAQMVDVVANTLGALLGALASVPIAWSVARRSPEEV